MSRVEPVTAVPEVREVPVAVPVDDDTDAPADGIMVTPHHRVLQKDRRVRFMDEDVTRSAQDAPAEGIVVTPHHPQDAPADFRGTTTDGNKGDAHAEGDVLEREHVQGLGRGAECKKSIGRAPINTHTHRVEQQ